MIIFKKKSKYFCMRAIVCLMVISSWGWIVSSGRPVLAKESVSSMENKLSLPAPGSVLSMSPSYQPTTLKGITIYSENPFRLDFVIDSGDARLSKEILPEEITKLIKYFMAALTIPEDQMWVNLSPYEKDRIIPEVFGQTAMGRDLLSQDYLLKQLTASLMSPKEETGKAYWEKVNTKTYETLGNSEVPVDTFNKVWIVPDQAHIYEHVQGVFIIQSRLKVLLEEDYLAMQEYKSQTNGEEDLKEGERQKLNQDSSQMMREIILPVIEKEVNEGQTFAPLRQIYHAMILAAWFKGTLRNNILTQVYADQEKVNGIDIDPAINKEIYEQYLEAYRTGVFDFIKEEYDPVLKETVPKKYVSGGVWLKKTNKNMTRVAPIPLKMEISRIGDKGLNATFQFRGIRNFIAETDDLTLVPPLQDTSKGVELRSVKIEDIYEALIKEDREIIKGKRRGVGMNNDDKMMLGGKSPEKFPENLKNISTREILRSLYARTQAAIYDNPNANTQGEVSLLVVELGQREESLDVILKSFEDGLAEEFSQILWAPLTSFILRLVVANRDNRALLLKADQVAQNIDKLEDVFGIAKVISKNIIGKMLRLLPETGETQVSFNPIRESLPFQLPEGLKEEDLMPPRLYGSELFKTNLRIGHQIRVIPWNAFEGILPERSRQILEILIEKDMFFKKPEGAGFIYKMALAFVTSDHPNATYRGPDFSDEHYKASNLGLEGKEIQVKGEKVILTAEDEAKVFEQLVWIDRLNDTVYFGNFYGLEVSSVPALIETLNMMSWADPSQVLEALVAWGEESLSELLKVLRNPEDQRIPYIQEALFGLAKKYDLSNHHDEAMAYLKARVQVNDRMDPDQENAEALKQYYIKRGLKLLEAFRRPQPEDKEFLLSLTKKYPWAQREVERLLAQRSRGEDNLMLGAADRENKDIGGIDMDPWKLKMHRDGSSPVIQMPLMPPGGQNIQFEGFQPILINISPITNLPQLLGLTEKSPPHVRGNTNDF